MRTIGVLLVAGLAFAGCQDGGGSGGAWGTASSSSGRDRFYLPDVQAVLVAQCTQCHAGGEATAQAAYALTPRADADADFQATRDRVDLQAPASSLLLQKATGAGGHPALLAPGDAQHAVLVEWIAQGGSLQSGTFVLGWDPNREPDIAGYRVYYGTAPGAYGPPIDVGNQTTHRLDGLVSGARYYIAVTAYDTSGLESTFSNEVSKVAR